jgi:hypothetical protein
MITKTTTTTTTQTWKPFERPLRMLVFLLPWAYPPNRTWSLHNLYFYNGNNNVQRSDLPSANLRWIAIRRPPRWTCHPWWDRTIRSHRPLVLIPPCYCRGLTQHQVDDEQMEGLFDRWTSDDFTVALMLFLNRFSGSAVDWVKDSADATWEKGPIRNAQEFYQMGEFVLISFHCFLYVTVSSSPLHILHSISSTFSNQMWRLSGEMSWKRKLQNMP